MAIEETLPAVTSSFSAAAPVTSAGDSSSVIIMPQAIKYAGATTPQPSYTTPQPTITLVPYSPPSGPSILQRMHEGYCNYHSSQKSLYTVMYPNNIFAAESYRLVTHSEYVKMERGCLSLMYSMVNDWFQPFNELEHELKVTTLKAFSGKFTHLDQCYRSSQMFPDPLDSRFVMHYGQYIDGKNMAYFFSEDKDPEESARTCGNVINMCRGVVNKMVRMGIRDVEIAALAGIILWNEVAFASSFDSSEKIRDRIYAELHNNMILTYGVATTGTRMGTLLCFMQDLNMVAREISEHVAMNKIFNPHTIDVWE